MKKAVRLSSLAKFGLFVLVTLTSAATFYLTSQSSTYVLKTQGFQTLLSQNTLLLIVMIGGIVGGILAFLFAWGLGTLVLMILDTRWYQNALYLALVIRYVSGNVLTASGLLIGDQTLAYSWIVSLLELVIFFACYYKLTDQDLQNSLIVTGIYVLIFVSGQWLF